MKKKGSCWTAYYNPETNRYFAEIIYTSREGREQYDYEITKEIFDRLGSFGEDYENERLIRTAKITYSFENTMYGTLGPERTVWDRHKEKYKRKAERRRNRRKKPKSYKKTKEKQKSKKITLYKLKVSTH